MDRETARRKTVELQDSVNKAYDAFERGKITEAKFNEVCDAAEKESERIDVAFKSRARANQFLKGPDEVSGWGARSSEWDPSAQGNPRVACKKWNPPSVFDATDDQVRSLFEAGRSNMKGFSTHVGTGDTRLKDAGSWGVRTKDWVPPVGLAEGTPGSLLPAQLIPQAWWMRYEPTRLFDYFIGSQAETQSISWIQHTGNTLPAAAVAELDKKPDLGPLVEAHTASFSTIAGMISVSRQFFDDFPNWASTVPHELQRAVIDAENDLVLNGSGDSPEMLGLLGQSSTLTRVCPTVSDVAYTQIDCLVQSFTDLRSGPAYAIADLVVMHPEQWDDIRRIKNSLGSFVLNATEANEVGGIDNIFGVPVALTTKCPLGTAVVLDTKIAVLAFTRMGIEIVFNPFGDWAYSHNAVQFRGEERVTIGVAYPKAINIVTNLNQGPTQWSS